MTFKLGLTGSIGMGKSTTARMFADAGCAVWDADVAVHRLYVGPAVEPMRALVPDAIVDGAVSRDQLRQAIAADPALLKRIEGVIHPMVGADRAAFVAAAGSDILVFDIPLLFETGGDARMDAVACVTIPEDQQRQRVLARGTMDAAQFEAILAKQMPNADKVARSDFVIVTDTLDHARAQVEQIVKQIRKRIDA